MFQFPLSMNDNNFQFVPIQFNVVFVLSGQVSTTSSHGIRMNIPKVSSLKRVLCLRSNHEFCPGT